MKLCKQCQQPHARPRADVCLSCSDKTRRLRDKANTVSAIDFNITAEALTGTCVICGGETDSPLIETCCKAHAIERNRRLEATRSNPLEIRDKFSQVFQTLETCKINARKKKWSEVKHA